MNLLEWSLQSFNVASVFYAIAFFLYAGQLVSEKKIFNAAPSWIARAGWLAQTTALLFRWRLSGIGHPPWSNLYESLVFFSWGVMGVHLFLEIRFGSRITGVFATAVTFVALGVATLHPNKEIEPLVPALQSYWILIHVFMACIAYAFFLASSFASVFYLLRDKTRLETMIAAAALVCVLFLSISAGKDFFLTGELKFFKVMKMAGSDGMMKDVIMNFKGPDGKPMQQFVALPKAAFFIWPALMFYIASAITLLVTSAKRRKPSFAKIETFGRWLFVAALIVHAGLLINIVIATNSNPEMRVASNPYRLAGVIMTLLIASFFTALMKYKEKILKRLPSENVLDRWGYEAVLLGVPFMTLNLITGAIWAYYAWGRYWGWDPKETWALITWFIYLIYLHMRVLGGWRGRKTALISVLGFFVVIFTYLGVNLVISGLHSYATS